MLTALACSLGLVAGPVFEVTVPAGPAAPLCVSLPEGAPSPSSGLTPKLYRLETASKSETPCQAESVPGGRFLWFFAPARAEEATHAFEVVWEKHDGAPAKEACTIVEARAGQYLFSWSGTPLLAYNYEFMKKEGATPRFDRCDYIHPVFGPCGEVLTEDFPEDHLHHRGIFWIWPRVVVGETTYDPWSLEDSREWPRSLRLGGTGPVCASLNADLVWRSASGDDLVLEHVRLRVYRPTGTTRLADLEIRLRAAGDAPTRIGGRPTENKGYGGLNVRFPPRSSAVITMDGAHMTEELVNQKAARWSDFSAVFAPATERSGIAVCAHPANPAWPERWCNRYYGLLGAASPGLSLLELNREKPVIFRYRLVIHEGTAAAADCEGQSRRYTAAPKIRWR